ERIHAATQDGRSTRRTNRRADRRLVVAHARRGEGQARSAGCQGRGLGVQEDLVRGGGRSRRLQARKSRSAGRRNLGRSKTAGLAEIAWGLILRSVMKRFACVRASTR